MVDVLKDIYSYLRDRNLSPSLHVRLLPAIHSKGQGAHDHAATTGPINEKLATGHP